MAHFRTDLRNAVKQAITASPHFALFTLVPAWSSGLSTDSLPAWTVATPSTRSVLHSVGYSERTVPLTIILKRSGGDEVEDAIDLDATALEAAIHAVLDAYPLETQSLEEEIRIDGEGEERIATLEMNLSVRLETALGQT